MAISSNSQERATKCFEALVYFHIEGIKAQADYPYFMRESFFPEMHKVWTKVLLHHRKIDFVSNRLFLASDSTINENTLLNELQFTRFLMLLVRWETNLYLQPQTPERQHEIFSRVLKQNMGLSPLVQRDLVYAYWIRHPLIFNENSSLPYLFQHYLYYSLIKKNIQYNDIQEFTYYGQRLPFEDFLEHLNLPPFSDIHKDCKAYFNQQASQMNSKFFIDEKNLRENNP